MKRTMIALSVAALLVLSLVGPFSPSTTQAQSGQSFEQQLAADYLNQYNAYLAANCPGGGCEQAAMNYMVQYALDTSGASNPSPPPTVPNNDQNYCLRNCINNANSQCQAVRNATVIAAGGVAVAAGFACAAASQTPLAGTLCMAGVTVAYLAAVAVADVNLQACKDNALYTCNASCNSVAGNGGSCNPTPTMLFTCLEYDWEGCYCTLNYLDTSPILIDVAGNGFHLDDADHGVWFDLRGDGNPRQFSWTKQGSDDAFLVIDANGNGRIDNGKELFGNYTAQPTPTNGDQRNGFLALAQYDLPAHFGNGDGVIDDKDAVWSALRLWQDFDHNGVSSANELHPLAYFGITGQELRYHETRRRDRNGNEFRYLARVRGGGVGRLAWDVFLKEAQ